MSEKKILIVEDSMDIQRLLQKVLRMAGFSVSIAANGNVALNMLRNEEPLPGVILLDLMMPEMDGYEFRRQQLRDPRIAGIPVIVMTAESGAQQKIKDLNANAFLKKPFGGIDEIIETVEKFFVLATS